MANQNPKNQNRIPTIHLSLKIVLSLALALFSGGAHSKPLSPINLAVRWVVYQNGSSVPILSQSQVTEVLQRVNTLWSPCGIRFQLERYEAAIPAAFRLQYHPADAFELDQIRHTWADPRQLLVVATGSWDRSGSLGNSFANAWTSLPGEIPYGVVLEAPVADYANLVAHELGHYLGLLHEGEDENLMHPVIHGISRELTPEQCKESREVAETFWTLVLRNGLGSESEIR